MRYTRAQLRWDLDQINNRLRVYELKAEGRNGYTGLDLYRKSGECVRNIECGTPKECLAAAHQFYFSLSE